jgi:hypothetical protein
VEQRWVLHAWSIGTLGAISAVIPLQEIKHLRLKFDIQKIFADGNDVA